MMSPFLTHYRSVAGNFGHEPIDWVRPIDEAPADLDAATAIELFFTDPAGDTTSQPATSLTDENYVTIRCIPPAGAVTVAGHWRVQFQVTTPTGVTRSPIFNLEVDPAI